MTGSVNKRKLLIWIPIAAILLNGAAYLIVTALRGSPSADPPTAVAKLTVGRPSTDSADHSGRGLVDDPELESRALARRSAGLAALDAGEYEKALIDFTEARALIGEKANVSELLRVTEDLRSKRDRAPAAPRPTHVAAAPSPPPPRPPMRAAVARRMAVRETPIPIVETPPPPPPAPASGLLIVSTTPRGLLVHVDEVAVDLSPMRAKVKPGPHRVALFDGDRKVYEATVDVKDGGTATLVKDLPVEMAVELSPPRETPPAPAPPVAPVARAEAPRTVAARMPAPTPRPRFTPAASPPVASENPGAALHITSPGLYGVVWVNGRPRGYPPLDVDDVAVGSSAKVEVRVNGIEKRTATVTVAAGRTLNVDLR